jgi:hypothetical protein
LEGKGYRPTSRTALGWLFIGLLAVLGALVVATVGYGSLFLIWTGTQWMQAADMKDVMFVIGVGRILAGMLMIGTGAGGLLPAGVICASFVRLALARS